MTWDELMSDVYDHDNFVDSRKFLSFFKVYRIGYEYDSFLLLPPDELEGEPYYIFIWYDDRMRILESGETYRRMKRNVRQYIECTSRAKPQPCKTNRLNQVELSKIEPHCQFGISQSLIKKYQNIKEV